MSSTFRSSGVTPFCGKKEKTPFLIPPSITQKSTQTHTTHLPQPLSASVHQLPISLGQPLVIDGQQQLQTDQEEIGGSLALSTLAPCCTLQGEGTNHLIQDQDLRLLNETLCGTLELTAKVLGGGGGKISKLNNGPLH